jgi:DNA-binding PadR family transcriptional regulator
VRAAALALLAEEPRNGYQLIQEIALRSGGVWKPSPGSIYPALQQLEDEGLIQSEVRSERKVFVLTDAGRRYVEAHAEDINAPWDAVAEPFAHLHGVRTSAAGAFVALQQVLAAGSAEQIERAEQVLNETRRALYRILADDPGPGGDVPKDDAAPPR